jgi:hypothetical protein
MRRRLSGRIGAGTGALLGALLLSGCMQPTKPAIDAAAADPHVRVPPVRYGPVLGTYAGARPVEPSPWTGAPDTEGHR